MIGAAYAHGTSQPAVDAFGWSSEPWIIGPLVLLAMLYATGSARLRSRSGRSARPMAALQFWAGFAALTLALTSPLHSYGTAVFSAHMVEHEILMVVAVPLMVAARPGAALLWGLPQPLRRAAARTARSRSLRKASAGATDLATATAVHAMVLWIWHAPPLFERATHSEGIHVVQHLSFILSAVLFWQAIFDRHHRRYSQGAAAMALFATSLQTGLLGALLTFSPRIWYVNGPDPFQICGLTRAEDQALAGLIMWVPACSLYVVAAVGLLARWLGQMEARHA